ncbi:3-methyl-2-oxobutanoate hydroxymethyltransferase, partial [Staphylococcus aureus]
YHFASAKHVEAACIYMLLVGVSLVMTVLGYVITVHVTLAFMILHGLALRTGAPFPVVVVVMLFRALAFPMAQYLNH